MSLKRRADLFISVAPWMVFVVSDQVNSGVGQVASASLAAGIAAAWAACRRRVDALSVVAMTLFGALALQGYLDDDAVISRLDKAVAMAVLGIVALASIFTRPISLRYMENMVPRPVDPDWLLHRNRCLTAWWGMSSLACSISMELGVELGGSVALTLLGWIVPLLCLYCSAFYTSHTLGEETIRALDPALNRWPDRVPSELVAEATQDCSSRQRAKVLALVEALQRMVDDAEDQCGVVDPSSGISWTNQCASCRKMRRMVTMATAVVREWVAQDGLAFVRGNGSHPTR